MRSGLVTCKTQTIFGLIMAGLRVRSIPWLKYSSLDECGWLGVYQSLQDLLRARICASHSGYRDKGVTVLTENIL